MAKSDIAQFVIPLLTIVASGLVASIVTFKLNARLQRRDLLRVKLEEAYEASHEYCNALGSHFLMYMQVFRGEIDLNQANELTSKNTSTDDGKWYRRVELLISLYVPAAQACFSEVLEARSHMNALVSEYRRRYLQGRNRAPDLFSSLGEQIEALETVEQKLKAAIVVEARRL